ncbi:MAG: TaqI-like C-terminal specificity domain-containing protein [Saprospiraceae bacterium]
MDALSNKQSALDIITELITRFDEQLPSYKKADYNETQTRKDFIDPFFEALGWDMNNKSGHAEAYREVIHEDKLKVNGVSRAPDYSFRLVGGKRLFFLEAKKPSVLIKDEIPPAYQVRRYGWSAGMPISLMTDFEEFAIYDTTLMPKIMDKASKGRIRYLTYKDYIDEWDFIWDTFSRERIVKGGLDKFLAESKNKKGTGRVDHEFLTSLDAWRKYLATSISLNNKTLDEDEINYAVQQTLDRIIFLRIAEDRGVEPYANMQLALKQGDYYKNLLHLFKEADARYNSGLFDFKKDKISSTLTVDNKVIKTILNQLYYPESPYEFSVLPVEILGSAYEQFLGKQIRIDSAHRARIEEKPEVRKAGGVYYTPQYIVDYIVEHTLGQVITERASTPEAISALRIVDPACGSGSFLIGAYQYLLDWHLDYYTHHARKTGKNAPLTPDGHLTTAEKKRILLNNIYGVDIDVNAVEVTKLSLLLKCLEGETHASIAHQMSMFKERVLPTLEDNIKSGNSLIDLDFYASQLDFGEEKKIKPFSWERGFPEVFKEHGGPADRSGGPADRSGGPADRSGGFDVVIGNPPYVRQELLGDLKTYYRSHYKVYHGMADLYSYFVEKGIGLLHDQGVYGVIVANKWMRANYGEPLRKYLKQQDIHEIIDFGDLPVFQTATTYPCILIVSPNSKEDSLLKVTTIKSLDFESLGVYVTENHQSLKLSSLDDSGWNLGSEAEQNLLQKLKTNTIPLGEYVNGKIYRGVLTGLNEAFVINEETKDRLIKEDVSSAEVIKPFLAGRDIKKYQTPFSDKYLIFIPKGYTNSNGKNPKSGWRWLQEKYPAIAKHLEPFEAKAKKRFDKGEYWWELRACEYYDEFEKPKIMLPDIALKMQAQFDTKATYCVNTAYIIPVNDKYLLGLINSKITSYYYSKISTSIRGGYFRFIRQYLEQIPIPIVAKNKNEIITLVDQLLFLHQEKSTTKLESSLAQIQGKIDYCERRVDELVYELYGLTEEERKVVEGV